MVTKIIREIRASPLMVILGGVIGILGAMSAPFITDRIADAYDARYPVWRDVTGAVQERRGDQVIIEIAGRKARECRFLRINAQTLHPDGLHNANITRVDQQEFGVTRPLGQQYLGLWLVIPAPHTTRAVVVTVEHMCGDRLVMGKLATVRLTNE
jgi:hypothetical protein